MRGSPGSLRPCSRSCRAMISCSSSTALDAMQDTYQRADTARHTGALTAAANFGSIVTFRVIARLPKQIATPYVCSEDKIWLMTA